MLAALVDTKRPRRALADPAAPKLRDTFPTRVPETPRPPETSLRPRGAGSAPAHPPALCSNATGPSRQPPTVSPKPLGAVARPETTSPPPPDPAMPSGHSQRPHL